MLQNAKYQQFLTVLQIRVLFVSLAGNTNHICLWNFCSGGIFVTTRMININKNSSRRHKCVLREQSITPFTFYQSRHEIVYVPVMHLSFYIVYSDVVYTVLNVVKCTMESRINSSCAHINHINIVDICLTILIHYYSKLYQCYFQFNYWP